ncbi:pyridoxamine 5'-phosphate oxidase family protein [Tateyamaria omphalii]|uniref:FAD-binding oxidoreductase n=1 Tax=Tateyamaria omphalii TaxID=299262 RepID=UPI001C99611F|nr:pyridoxamine 5'-phosphate oxidase family protein [Tateyamaria omphalii]MBY5934719.1 pyridoxamine 5'-phosphate oxidase family protein [Tateyamaria omphalii]
MIDAANPFHAGELEAQARIGKTDVSEWASGFIRPFMPDQHRDFFAQLPFLVLASADRAGRHWVTVLDGPEGFIASPDQTTLRISAQPDRQDPLAHVFQEGSDVGLLGIELHTRRRNRMNGRLSPEGNGLVINVSQSFGNCPQYIHARNWQRVPAGPIAPSRQSDSLSQEQMGWIATADTLFIGTGHHSSDNRPSNGFDASHRGGPAGFIEVIDNRHLRIPDYAGNNFFNTIGNLLENPAVGLVFVDFDTGGLLHISGRASIDWIAQDSHDAHALRMIDVSIDVVLERPAALSLRWSKQESEPQTLVVTQKVRESADVTSFYLAREDTLPTEPFSAGQHLPILIDVPDQPEPVMRTYSLSNGPRNGHYRLTIKREPSGLVSPYLHDVVKTGDRIRALAPSGDFVLPKGSEPIVLVSAGIGVTPMLSMLHAIAASDPERQVWFVHGARNSASHTLKDEVQHLVSRHENIRSLVYYSQPLANDDQGTDYDAIGRVSAERLIDIGAGPDTRYLLCGPARFLADIKGGLEQSGVESQRIFFETFGPAS